MEDILLREPAAGYQVMKKVAGVISTRLRDIKEELIEVLDMRLTRARVGPTMSAL